MDYARAREDMVKYQLMSRGISDQRVLDTFNTVPRQEFVPENIRSAAYDDCALPIGEDQTISQPYMVAIMTEQLGLKGNEKVLEIGTGSGYQAAILAELAKKVYTIERVESLSARAEKIITGLGYKNIEFLVGDGTEGHPEAGPYDAILVTAACPGVPKPLVEQLKEGGRLVVPIGDVYQQILTQITKRKGKLSKEESVPCIFVPLIGKYGWKK
jgi:protein-L-isoaspartate(D-aspartate) O-methyltransferase